MLAELAIFFDGHARLFESMSKVDPRGVLIPFDFDQMPFVPRRSFVVTQVPAGTRRGGHAHRYGMQFLICLQGKMEILMRYRTEAVTLVLDEPTRGLLLGPEVWGQQTYLNDGTVLLAFASETYDPDSYVQDWAQSTNIS